jgi:hypothetical protein
MTTGPGSRSPRVSLRAARRARPVRTSADFATSSVWMPHRLRNRAIGPVRWWVDRPSR